MFTSGPGTSYNNGRVVSNHFACSSQSKTSKKSGIKKTESEKVKRKFVRSSAFDFVNHAGFDGFDCGSNDRDRAECVRVFIGERGERSVRRTEYFENSEGESYLKVFPKDVLLLEYNKHSSNDNNDNNKNKNSMIGNMFVVADVYLPTPRLDGDQKPASFVKSIVEKAQEAMGLSSGSGDGEKQLPTGVIIQAAENPRAFVNGLVKETRDEVESGATLDDNEWTKVLKSVDVDVGLLLLSVVVIVPTFRKFKLSPVLGFLGAGLGLNKLGLFIENQEVDQFCELGIQFLLFEMGLELSLTRLKALAKYAFGLGFTQVAAVNVLFAMALLPAGNAIGTKVLEYIQPGNDQMLQVTSTLEAVVIGFALSLSSSAFGLQLLQDKNQLATKFGTASLGVLLFQDLAVVPFIILLPVLSLAASTGGGQGMDFGVMAAGGATSMLDLGVLAFAGRSLALFGFRAVEAAEAGTDVFVAMSLLTLFGFSFACSAIGFSDSLGAFLAGIVIADTKYAHQIIDELNAFKGLFLSLFFVTIGTTIDVPLAIEMFPIILLMTTTLMATKTGVVTALGPLVGLSWREALVAGAVLSQGGEFAFVIFGQATSTGAGNLFPQKLEEVLVCVVILSMALTPIAVEIAMKIAGPELPLGNCSDDSSNLSSTELEACEVSSNWSDGGDTIMAVDQTTPKALLAQATYERNPTNFNKVRKNNPKPRDKSIDEAIVGYEESIK
jgi:Kef-type K+ transport system membrane component KefB